MNNKRKIMDVYRFSRPGIGELKIYSNNEKKVEQIRDFFLVGENINLPQNAGFVIITPENLVDVGIWQRRGNTNLIRKIFGFHGSNIQELSRKANHCTKTQKEIISFEMDAWKQYSLANPQRYFEKEYGGVRE